MAVFTAGDCDLQESRLSLDAYDHFLRGMAAFHQFSEQAWPAFKKTDLVDKANPRSFPAVAYISGETVSLKRLSTK
jgi:hypothetical protein